MRADALPAMNGVPSTIHYDYDASHIRHLQYDNSRLRRLVADRLLEKMKLEENLCGAFNRQTAGR